MDNVFLIGAIVTAVAAAFAGFVFYSVYGGSRATLANAKIGEIYNFSYEQPMKGDPERFLARVLDIHKLDAYSISRLNSRSPYRRHDPQFVRTNHLVTCKMPNGAVRNFYAERTTHCRKPLLAGALFKTGLAALL
jgi:hypothetical protein